MTALAIVGVVAAMIALGCVVLIAVLCFRALSRAYELTDSIHDRMTQQVDRVVDRFMAADFAAYKSFAMAEHADDGQQYIPESLRPPEPDEEHPVSGDDWGALGPRRLDFSAVEGED
jgi:hypothetical protein